MNEKACENINSAEDVEITKSSAAENSISGDSEAKETGEAAEAEAAEALKEDKASEEEEKGASTGSFWDEEKHFPLALKIIIPIFCMIVCAYLAGVFIFYGKYGANTTVNGVSVFRQTPEEVKAWLEAKADEWSLILYENGTKCGALKSENIGLSYDASNIYNYPVQNPWIWPYQFFTDYNITVSVESEFDEQMLESALSELSYAHTDEADFDAAVTYNGNKFVVVDSSVDVIVMSKLLPIISEQISADTNTGESLSYEISGDDIYMSTPEIMYTACDEANEYLNAKVTLAFDGGVVIDRDQIAEWISFDAFMNVSIDTELVQKWIDELCEKYDGTAIVRYITSPAGDTTEYSGGEYGYYVHTDTMLEDIVTTIEAHKTSEFYDFGNSYCEVDISRQKVWCIIDGNVKLEADVVTGAYGSHDTTCGQWSIRNKARDVTLVGETDPKTKKPEYESPVNYWMAVTPSAIGFHDASWQSAFGGTRYKDGYGSHGCINMAYSDVAKLYDMVWVGMPVIIHD